MTEQAPNTSHEELKDAFLDARAAAIAHGVDHEVLKTHSSVIETVGGPIGPSITHSTRESISKNRVEPMEQFYASNGIHNRVDGKATMSSYDARVKSPISNPNDAEGGVTIHRTDSRGESYSHTFKNPETARKFAKLIAKQTLRRSYQENGIDRRMAA